MTAAVTPPGCCGHCTAPRPGSQKAKNYCHCAMENFQRPAKAHMHSAPAGLWRDKSISQKAFYSSQSTGAWGA